MSSFWLRFASLAGLLLCTAAAVLAVPAAPGPTELRQPDGSIIKAVARGDEWFHWYETTDGQTLSLDRATGAWRVGGMPPVRTAAAEPKRVSQPERVVPPTGTANVPIICINFDDRSTTYIAAQFSTMLFGAGKSMRSYYEETSYGAFSVSAGPGGVVGWYTASRGHDYYGRDVAGSDQYPATLVREAVEAADTAGFDFGSYDADSDGLVDTVMVIHQGTGQEAGGPTTDIWSHHWDLYSANYYGDGDGPYTTSSGKIVNDYTIQPEVLFGGMQTVGVFCHEYGHALGLPDLYDTDGSSEGVGDWCLMAGGSWNYTSAAGDSPSHPGAWAKATLGWITPTVRGTTLYGASIPNAESNAFAYKLRATTTLGSEYFLVENRQQSLFDAGLPGAGLLVWHVDDTQTTNKNEWYPGHTSSGHYLVALEQADGLYELEKTTDRGDTGDPFPGSTGNRLFHRSTTTPNSMPYSGAAGQFDLGGIGDSASTMTCDIIFDVGSRPDAMIRAQGEADGGYLLDNLYNANAAGQTKSQYVATSAAAVYDIRIQNDAATPDTVIITGGGGGPGWTVAYYDALTGGSSITSQVTGPGWSKALSAGAQTEIRVEVTPDAGVVGGATKDVLITATSQTDGTRLDTVKASTTQGTVITIGTGTSSAVFPMGTYYHDERTQAIYLASELGGAGSILAIGLDVTTIPGQVMNAWTIRMKHTALSTYPASPAWEGSGWTTCYTSVEPQGTTGWRMFGLSTPFAYNGTSNLMVDFSFNNSSYTTDGGCRYTATAGNRTIYYRTDSTYGDPLAWDGTSSPTPSLAAAIPNIRLVVAEPAPAPTVTSITPSTGANDASVSITDLAGTGFLVGATVKLAKTDQTDIDATDVTVVSPTQITCNLDTNGATTGAWNVVVTNADTQSGTLTDGFTVQYPAPTVTSIDPVSGTDDGSASATIAGTNFRTGATTKLMKSGETDIAGTSVSVVGTTQITCSFDITGAAVGDWSVVVTNDDAQSGALTDGFEVLVGDTTPPEITGWHICCTHPGLPEMVTDIADGYVEPRSAGVYKLMLEFSEALDPATVSTSVIGILGMNSGDCSSYVSQVTLGASDDSLEVELSSALADQDTYKVTVSSAVCDPAGLTLTGDCDLVLSALNGDANSTRSVNTLDLMAVRAHAGETLSEANARYDVNMTGTINTLDLMAARAQSGHTAPAPDFPEAAPAPDEMLVLDAGWSRISVPLDLTAPAPEDVLAPAGTPGQDWQLYDYVDSGFRACPSPDVRQFEPGRAYWVQSAKPVEVPLRGRPVDAGRPFSLDVAPGWQMVGSPFAEPVPWDCEHVQVKSGEETLALPEAVDRGWLYPTAYGYDRGCNIPVHPERSPSGLLPWGGYYVNARQPITLQLTPGTVKTQADPAVIAPISTAPGDWQIRLIASAGEFSDISTTVGVVEGASAMLEPHPPVGPGVDIYVSPVSALTDGSPGYAVYLQDKPVDGNSDVRLTVETDQANTPVTVSWPDLSSLPANVTPYLVDTATGKRVYMRTTTRYSFTSGSGRTKRNLQLELREKQAGAHLVTSASAAATSNGGGEVVFTLSTDANVEICVTNIAGRVVKKVVPATAFPVGTNRVQWDGRNGHGSKVPAGRYLVTIQAAQVDGLQSTQVRPLMIRR